MIKLGSNARWDWNGMRGVAANFPRVVAKSDVGLIAPRETALAQRCLGR